MTARSAKQKRDLSLLHYLITVSMMLIIGSIPPAAPITALGMKIVGIFAGMVYGWSTIGLIFPSLLGLSLFAVVGQTPISQLFMEGFGNSVVVLLIFIFIFAAAITHAGIGEFIATWLITRRIITGRPWLLTAVFFLAAFLTSAAVNSFGSMIICWGILYDLCKKVGYKPGDVWPAFMVFGITVSAILGSGSFAFKTIPMLVIGVYEKIGGPSIDFLAFSLVFWALSFLVLLGVFFLGRVIYRVDVTPLKQIDENMFNKDCLILSRFQKVNFLFLILLIVALLLPSLMPTHWFLTIVLNKLGSAGIILAIVMLMVCVRVEGQPLVDFPNLAAKGVLWEPIILTACVLPICNAMLAENAGIKAWLVQTLQPVFMGKSIMVFALLSFSLAMLLTNFANNGMTALIFLPVVVSFAELLGIDPTVMTILLIFTVHIALITPAACPMAGLMFSNTAYITPKEIYRYGFPLLIWTLAVIIVVGIPLANLLF